MAKIEIWSRNVKRIPKLPIWGHLQHLYLVYTDDQGNREVLRGGPEFGNPFGTDELAMIRQDYNHQKQPDGSDTVDWNDGRHIGETIFYATQEEVVRIWEKIWHRGTVAK